MLKKCKWCGKEVNMRCDYNYCSPECRQASRRGKDPNFLNDISEEAKAYLIGLILGDGNLSYTKITQSVERMNLTLSNQELIEKVRVLIAPHRSMYIRRAKKETHANAFATETRNDDVISFFKTYGLVHRKSKILKYPSQFDASNPYTPHFIRGYMDANGSFFKNIVQGHIYAHCAITIGSKMFATGMHHTLNELGIRATKITDSRRDDTYYVKVYSTENMQKIYDLMYKNEDYWVLRPKKEKLEYLLSEISKR